MAYPFPDPFSRSLEPFNGRKVKRVGDISCATMGCIKRQIRTF